MKLICTKCGGEKSEREFVPRSITCISCFNIIFEQLRVARVPTAEEIEKIENTQKRKRIYHLEYQKKNRKKIMESDCYIAASFGMPTKELRKYPQFIDTERVRLRIIREIKNQS